MAEATIVKGLKSEERVAGLQPAAPCVIGTCVSRCHSQHSNKCPKNEQSLKTPIETAKELPGASKGPGATVSDGSATVATKQSSRFQLGYLNKLKHLFVTTRTKY